MPGLASNSDKIVIDGLSRSLDSKSSFISNKANVLVKQSIFGFSRPVYDTANLLLNTKGECKKQGKGLLITFGTYNVPYLKSVFYGLGVNRKYGARKWLELAQKNFMNFFNLK